MRPLTKKQISKCVCYRCQQPATYQWNACADDNIWRPLCTKCDVELNIFVLRWMGFTDWRDKIEQYCDAIGYEWDGSIPNF